MEEAGREGIFKKKIRPKGAGGSDKGGGGPVGGVENGSFRPTAKQAEIVVKVTGRGGSPWRIRRGPRKKDGGHKMIESAQKND